MDAEQEIDKLLETGDTPDGDTIGGEMAKVVSNTRSSAPRTACDRDLRQVVAAGRWPEAAGRRTSRRLQAAASQRRQGDTIMLKRTMVALALSLLAQPAAAQGLVMVRDISYDMALVDARRPRSNTAASSASRSASVWLTAVAMCW